MSPPGAMHPPSGSNCNPLPYFTFIDTFTYSIDDTYRFTATNCR